MSATKKKPSPPSREPEPKTIAFSVGLKLVSMSPRKLRLVAKAIKNMPIPEAVTRLSLTNTKRTGVFEKLLKQLLSDAKANFKIDPSTVRIKHILVDEALKLKRMDKSHSARFAGGTKIKRKSKIKIYAEGDTYGTKS